MKVYNVQFKLNNQAQASLSQTERTTLPAMVLAESIDSVLTKVEALSLTYFTVSAIVLNTAKLLE